MKIISKLTAMLKKLSYTQKIFLGIVLGYFVYTQLVVVENFFSDDKKDVKIEDEPVKTGLFDKWASNLGLKTDNMLKAKRQEEAKQDNYKKYEGDDIDVRKALAIADEYKKYD